MAIPHLQMHKQMIRMRSAAPTHTSHSAATQHTHFRPTSRSLAALQCQVTSLSATNSGIISAALIASSNHKRSKHSFNVCSPFHSRLHRSRHSHLLALQAATVVAKSEVPTPPVDLPPTFEEVDTALSQIAGLLEASQELLTLTTSQADQRLQSMNAAGTDSTAFELSMLLNRTSALFPLEATRWSWQKHHLVKYILYCRYNTAKKPSGGKKGAAAAAAAAVADEDAGLASVCGKDTANYLLLAWKLQKMHSQTDSGGKSTGGGLGLLKQLAREDSGLFSFKMSTSRPKYVLSVTLNLNFFKTLPLEPWIIIPRNLIPLSPREIAQHIVGSLPVYVGHPIPAPPHPSPNPPGAAPFLASDAIMRAVFPLEQSDMERSAATWGWPNAPVPACWVLEVNDSLPLEPKEIQDKLPHHSRTASPTTSDSGSDSESSLPSSSNSSSSSSSSSSSRGSSVDLDVSDGSSVRAPLQPAPPINTVILQSHENVPYRAMLRHLASVRHVALDVETSGYTNTLVLLQICLPEVAGTFVKSVYILDLVMSGHVSAKKMVGGLRRALQDPGICKILHSPLLDYTVLAQQHQVKMVGVVDTQILYGLVRAVEGNVTMLCTSHLTRGPEPTMAAIGLGNLLARFGIDHDLKDDFKAGYKTDAKFWSRRPLSKEMIKYARMDVQFLLPMYHAMVRRILDAEPRFLTDPELYKSLPYLEMSMRALSS